MPDFATAVSALIGHPLATGELIAVAVSGGPDSLALLKLAHTAFGLRVRALTVDHGLRPEAADEAALVARIAVDLGVPHVTLHWAGSKATSNLQAAARTERYRLMGDWCAANGVRWLATGHHAGDAAETLLLRLARGSGSGGLTGIRARRPLQPGVELVRPLLGLTKADLGAVLAGAGWTAVDDPSNRASRFDRTRARALLAATPWLAPARLAVSAAHLAEAEAALVWTTGLAWRGRVIADADDLKLDAAGLPRELARRLLVRAITTLAPGPAPRGPAIGYMLDRLMTGGGGTLAGVAVRSINGIWQCKLAPPRRKVIKDAAGRR